MKTAVFLAAALLMGNAHAQDQDASDLVDHTQAAQVGQLSDEARQQINQRQIASRLSQARMRTDSQTNSSLRSIAPQASIVEACLVECKRQGIEESTCEKGCRRN